MGRMYRRFLIAGLLAVLLVGIGSVTFGQKATPLVPVLTDVQKLVILNAAKDAEIARMKLQALLVSVQRPGFELDVNTLTYRPVK